MEMDQHLKMLGQTFFKFPFDLINELPFLPKGPICLSSQLQAKSYSKVLWEFLP